MLSELWWQRWPGRLEYEIELLRAAGLNPVLDETAKHDGLARVTVSVPVTGVGIVEMRATFPDLYPYFCPQVVAPSLDLGHHQHPFSKNLCLIGRATENWSPQDTLAMLLTEQVGPAVAAGNSNPPPGPERDALPEERQGEPFSDYYSYAPNVMVLMDGAWTIPNGATCGALSMGLRGVLPLDDDDPSAHTLGVVATIHDRDGRLLAAAHDDLLRPFGVRVPVRWSRVDAPIRSDDPRVIWDTAAAVDDEEPPVGSFGSRTAPKVQIRAIVFPEEVAWRESGDGWIFVVRQPGIPLQIKPSRKRGLTAANKTTPGKYWLVRVGYAGPRDLAARVPEVEGLGDRRAVVIGTGALGSTIAIQLARAGVGTLVTIDRDTLEPGNTVRHAASFLHSGRFKAVATSLTALEHSPYTASQFNTVPIGTTRDVAGGISQGEALDSCLADADIVIDATAEIGVQHLLADEARRRRLPYLCVTATNGGWGGMVALIGPSTEGCWLCLLQHMTDGTIPTPRGAPTSLVQPPGCSMPTFTGAGFDLDQVSLHAVRVIVATLLRDTPGRYPAPPHDVAVLALRDHDGTPTLPTWTGHGLPRHPKCQGH